MPWNIILALVIISQFLLIVYMRGNHQSTEKFLQEQLTTHVVANAQLQVSLEKCSLSKNATISATEKIHADTLRAEQERRIIEAKLCELGWGSGKDLDRVTNALSDERVEEEMGKIDENYIMPDDVFDDNINRLLKNAYDCATGRVCIR